MRLEAKDFEISEKKKPDGTVEIVGIRCSRCKNEMPFGEAEAKIIRKETGKQGLLAIPFSYLSHIARCGGTAQ